MTRRATLVAALLLGLGLSFSISSAPTPMPSKADQLREGMRTLWDDHVVWTRLYIISSLADLPDNAVTTERLLQNQVDIGNAIKPFYGDAAGDKLTALLKEHILIAADIVKAAKGGDTAKRNSSKTRWSANADEIAAFLSAANPKNWPAAEMKSMMHDHLTLTASELEARLNKDWKADVAAFDRIEEQIRKMADMLSEGIIQQLPAKVA